MFWFVQVKKKTLGTSDLRSPNSDSDLWISCITVP